MSIENDYRIYELRDPKLWGPQFWTFLYLSALGLPVTLSTAQQAEFSRLLKTFHLFLPCMECRIHYSEMIKNIDTRVRTREETFNLVLLLHNKVRERLNKKTFSREDVISYFSKYKKWRYYMYTIEKYSVPLICILIVVIAILRCKQR